MASVEPSIPDLILSAVSSKVLPVLLAIIEVAFINSCVLLAISLVLL